jgi:isocitrate dehydrogenase
MLSKFTRRAFSSRIKVT